MGKGYKRRYYRGRDKYSVEQSCGVIPTNADGNGGLVVVPASTTQGMRKVKHITVSMAHAAESSGAGNCLWWALVYVPQGTGVGNINISGTGTMYEPNQYVMSCGVFDFDGGPLRVHCPTSRNLNSGDSIALIIHTLVPQSGYPYVVRYAITLQ